MPKIKLRIRELSDLANRINIPLKYLTSIAFRAEELYRFWSKPKPMGGVRRYSEPKSELKRIQRRLDKLFKTVTYPSTSHYGIPGRSNITNALEHNKPKVLLNLDLKDFFPSIRRERVYRALVEEQECSPLVSSLITRLVTVNDQLPQGAPTSTDIANMVTFSLQRRLNGLAIQWGYKFTSYADDLSFSGKNYQEEFKSRIYLIIKDEKFALRNEKELIATKSGAQVVTGINITHSFGISREKRKKWRAENYNTQRDYTNQTIDEQVLQKSKITYLGRLIYIESVKNISKRLLSSSRPGKPVS